MTDRALCGALMPAFGTLAVEGMIGGRPIATVRLHTPIEHAGFTVRSKPANKTQKWPNDPELQCIA